MHVQSPLSQNNDSCEATQHLGGLRRCLSEDRENVNGRLYENFSRLFHNNDGEWRFARVVSALALAIPVTSLDTFCNFRCLCHQNQCKSIWSSFMNFWTLICSNFSRFVPDFTKNPCSNVSGHGFLSLFVLWQFMVTLTQNSQNLSQSL